MLVKILIPIIALVCIGCVVEESPTEDLNLGCTIDSTTYNIFQQNNGTFLNRCRLILRDGSEDTIYSYTETPWGCPSETLYQGQTYSVEIGAHGPQCLLDHAANP